MSYVNARDSQEVIRLSLFSVAGEDCHHALYGAVLGTLEALLVKIEKPNFQLVKLHK